MVKGAVTQYLKSDWRDRDQGFSSIQAFRQCVLQLKVNLIISDLINQRLSGSLSVEERIGEKPEWMRNLDPYLANHFSNIELPLPSPLKEYQEKMDEIDSIINDMMVLKEYFRAKFYDEIK
ncbi:hypothetical protein [Klebsiella pneumoniae]|uniref:hypothetical protein n=1 Tax=Klebsiella pneumoniae TaxID=573 RepID=UPI001D0E59AF|nr:hypothetical protein [Klebsiella pneumoniae]